MIWQALVNPMYEPKTAADQDRISRYNIYLICKMLNKLPDEVEAMDLSWYRDFSYFANAERAAAEARKKS